MAGGSFDVGDSDSVEWPAGTRYFTQVTPDDHQGWLYIITLLSFVYVLIAFAIRFFVKYGMYGHDDWALLTATLLAVGQYIAVLIGLSEGIGKSSRLLSLPQMSRIENYSQAHTYLYFLAHSASKISTALLTERLFENGRKRNQRLCHGLVVISALYGIASILASTIQCPNPAYPQPGDHSCPNRIMRWQIILSLDIFTEALLVIVPLGLVLDILVKRSAKITVTAVFAFRLVDVLFVAMNLRQIKLLEHSTDYGLAIVPPLIWTQTELLWSIISASLPCLKTFMRPFDKIDEDTWRSNNNMYSSTRSGRSWTTRRPDDRNGSVPLEDITGHEDGNVISASGSDRILPLRPEPVGSETTVTHATTNGSSPGGERGSWGSQDHIIKVSKQWDMKRASGPRELYQLPSPV